MTCRDKDKCNDKDCKHLSFRATADGKWHERKADKPKSEYYTIVNEGMTLDDILIQARAIKKFPGVIKIYDRVFTLSNLDELTTLMHGIECGWFMAEEFYENRPGQR